MNPELVEAKFIELVEEMVVVWKTAPKPRPVALPDLTRAIRSEAGAIAVIWGWTARVLRMAEAGLLLHREGFDVELAPLLRSMQEHAIALPWLVDRRGAAFQALARERANGWSRFKTAQTDAWTLEDEAALLLDAASVVETDTDTFAEDRHLHTFQRARTYGLAALYQAWLVETWSTHATMMSSEPYFSIDSNSQRARFRRIGSDAPPRFGNVGAIAIAVHTSLLSYESCQPGTFSGRLQEWESRFGFTMDSL